MDYYPNEIPPTAEQLAEYRKSAHAHNIRSLMGALELNSDYCLIALEWARQYRVKGLNKLALSQFEAARVFACKAAHYAHLAGIGLE